MTVKGLWHFLTTYSLLLVFGTLIALVWANTDAASYHHFVEFELWNPAPIGEAREGHRALTVHYLFNDLLMAFFFATAAKEVWEAVVLQNGSLRGKKAATPLFSTLGGMLGPLTVYLGLATILGSETYDAVSNGWAIPTATDIAFSYLVGRLVFGAGHPAVRFLLLLAIADDAAGLIVLAIFYPSDDLAPLWLLVSLGAALTAYILFNWLPRYLDRGHASRSAATWVRHRLHVWPYALAGAVSWFAFMKAGLHPALGLLPVIPAIPHADRPFGLFAEEEQYMTDLLNTIEHALHGPVQVILFFFGLLNAGVVFQSIGTTTWLVLAGLLIGKPVGIALFGWIAARPLRLGIPDGMRTIDLLVVGCVASIGFTVSLFVASVAFDSGPVQDAAKMGALFSFAAALISMVAARLAGVKKKAL
ncbi:Na+/H+ antiporter NhaA [Allosediminivita pacifica]|nr:Na+/H+ antiporter NhaA [Allosediminivita pacifica]